MSDRELDIDNAYAETCSWVLDRSMNNEASAKQSQFLSWLKSEETFFWISGKAGCGKSTLIKYVYQNSKTREELCQWADGKNMVLIGYFFFDRGDKDQKSREGMLRSILYQVLNPQRDLIPKVFNKFFTNKLPLSQEFTTWTNLSNAFVSMLDHLCNSKICLFLDGLDEYRIIDRLDQYTEERMDLIYDGTNEDEAWGRSTWITEGHREIVRFLRQIKNRDNMKVCFSSRELNVFEQEFRNFPRLQVHEHTAESIAHYCKGRLTEEAPDLMDRSEFVSSITGKSSGVFLWVRIVVDMLVDGNSNGDSKEELLKTLDKLPRRLGGRDGLYMRMMQNIKREYLSESKRLFQLVIGWNGPGPLDIITLFLAEPGHLEADGQQELRARNDKALFQSWEELRPRWKDLERRLKSRCGGLLEGTQNVQFMHQTAKEFISRSYLWDKIFPSTDGFVGESARLAMLSGLVRRLKCCAEAVVKLDSVRDPEESNDPPKVDNEIPSPYRDINVPSRGSQLLCGAMSQTDWLSNSCDLSEDYAALLDELDNTGDELVKDSRHALAGSFRRSPTANISWVEFFLTENYEELPLSGKLKPESFLELAIMYGLFLYAEAKIRGKMIPRTRLQSLLLRATLGSSAEWTLLSVVCCPQHEASISELLLQEGADPNCQYMESNAAMVLQEVWTAWTGLLLVGLLNQQNFGVDSPLKGWIDTVKAFLRHGADPTVQFCVSDMESGSESESDNSLPTKIYTPNTAINAILGNKPRYKEDLAEIMELLIKAKANWGANRVARVTEDIG